MAIFVFLGSLTLVVFTEAFLFSPSLLQASGLSTASLSASRMKKMNWVNTDYVKYSGIHSSGLPESLKFNSGHFVKHKIAITKTIVHIRCPFCRLSSIIIINCVASS